MALNITNLNPYPATSTVGNLGTRYTAPEFEDDYPDAKCKDEEAENEKPHNSTTPHIMLNIPKSLACGVDRSPLSFKCNCFETKDEETITDRSKRLRLSHNKDIATAKPPSPALPQHNPTCVRPECCARSDSDVKTPPPAGGIRAEVHGRLKAPCNGAKYFNEGSTVTAVATTAASSSDIDSDTTKLWHMHVGHISERDYTKSAYDSCVYHQRLADGSHIYLLYVDDMLIATKSMSVVNSLKEQLKREFEMKDLGATKRILGMEIQREIQRDRPTGILYLSQKKYIERVLQHFEAEYIAAIEAVKEAIWSKGLVGDLGLKQESSIVYCDSQSAIHMTKNQMFHERTKHIDVRFHFIRDVVSQGTVMVEKIFTDENPADMMTKHIPEIKFKHCLDLIAKEEKSANGNRFGFDDKEESNNGREKRQGIVPSLSHRFGFDDKEESDNGREKRQGIVPSLSHSSSLGNTYGATEDITPVKDFLSSLSPAIHATTRRAEIKSKS
ncbi:hypothetical protein RJ639_040937 [Escallonia herrerae]|uniref:Reverse transcriptase Ty1/copia-type domain-containing protein n=1 Tax=Escallonia herrerae TaxID=1293975 RepID=A0AA89B4X4_9ASTE|nr:hypothetical protein RJ639_040937 [Escallonia herrerae]